MRGVYRYGPVSCIPYVFRTVLFTTCVHTKEKADEVISILTISIAFDSQRMERALQPHVSRMLRFRDCPADNTPGSTLSRAAKESACVFACAH